MTKIDRPEAKDRVHTVDDEKKRVLDFWDTTIPIPEVGIQDAPTRCYEINLEWAKIVMGLVSWLADIAAWKEAQHENYPAIQEILKFLQGSDCVDCNAVADCLNQNSDFTSFQNILVTQMEQTTQDFLDGLEEQYVDSPQDINPLIPAAAPDAPERNGLCYAIGAWVRLYCEAKETKIRQSSFLSQSWNALQDAIVDAYNVLNNVVGFIIPDDLFSCFVSNEDALTALNDETAINDLVCCLYDELNGITLVQGSLAAALTACAGNDLACLISNDLNLQHELNFFYVYGRALERDDLPLCPCEDFYTVLNYDFAFSNHGFTEVSPSSEYVNACCWTGGNIDVVPPGSRDQMFIRKDYTGDLPKVAGFVVEITRVDGNAGTGDDRMTVDSSNGSISMPNTSFANGNNIKWYRKGFVPAAISFLRMEQRVRHETLNTAKGYVYKIWVVVTPDSTVKGSQVIEWETLSNTVGGGAAYPGEM